MRATCLAMYVCDPDDIHMCTLEEYSQRLVDSGSKHDKLGMDDDNHDVQGQ